MNLPLMLTIKQKFNVPFIADPGNETASIIRDSGILNKLGKGTRVAVGVGSRGIVGLPEITRAVCQSIKETGAEPFIFPAMGSHGGGTSQGQIDVLNALGIHKGTVGADILSDVEGVMTGETSDGIPVYVDKNAQAADYTVLINRIKPHTKFKGPVESGIAKMMSIGIGKREGAQILHKYAVKFGLPYIIDTVSKKVMEAVHFLFGIAIIESPDKKVHSISVITPETMPEEENLLKKAFAILPRIPFDHFDLLIVDEIGKDISGTGMDTNVTGRNRDILGDFCIFPKVSRILVRDLTDKTHGNADGIGYADFTTRRLVDKIDIKITYTNALAAMSPEKAAIPVTMETDRDAVAAALESTGILDGKDARIVRIKNTSELNTIQISEPLAHLVQGIKYPEIEITEPASPMRFDDQGNLFKISE
jgi:hypothetical protein